MWALGGFPYALRLNWVLPLGPKTKWEWGQEGPSTTGPKEEQKKGQSLTLLEDQPGWEVAIWARMLICCLLLGLAFATAEINQSSQFSINE